MVVAETLIRQAHVSPLLLLTHGLQAQDAQQNPSVLGSIRPDTSAGLGKRCRGASRQASASCRSVCQYSSVGALWPGTRLQCTGSGGLALAVA